MLKILKLKLHWQIFIGIICGTLFGLFLTEHVSYVSWFGTIFLRGLRMVIVPLIFSSIASGVASLGGSGSLGRLGLKTMIYYVVTSLLSICTGLFFVNVLKPGVGADLGFSKAIDGLGSAASSTSFTNTLINVVPSNIFSAMTTGKMLSIIFFAILFGYFTTKIEEKYEGALRNMFDAVFEVMMKITMLIIKFAPIGVFGIVATMVARQAGDTGALLNVVGRLGMFMITVFASLGVHFLITIPLLLKFVGKVSPWKQFQAVSAPLLTAFSTSSSSATLPLTMEAVEDNVGVSNKVTSFTLPLGATVNMDGTALHECVAAMFIAQAYGIDLSFTMQMVVIFTALLASIGAAGIPMAGLVMISVILSAVGLPLEGVGMILAVDQILDMSRTCTNVWSDCSAATIIAKSEGETLNV